MNLAEWRLVLATAPATPHQVGAIQGEFGRLGVRDRAERLAISAALLGLDHLGSTRQLVMGDAGRLFSALRAITDRADLPVPVAVAMKASADGEGQDHDAGDPDGMTLAETLTAAVVLAIWAYRNRAREQMNAIRGAQIGCVNYAPPRVMKGSGNRSAHVRAYIGPSAHADGLPGNPVAVRPAQRCPDRAQARGLPARMPDPAEVAETKKQAGASNMTRNSAPLRVEGFLSSCSPGGNIFTVLACAKAAFNGRLQR